MAQITVYVPDEVAEKAREYRDEIVFSQVFTSALRDAMEAAEARKQSPVPDDDLEATIARLAEQKKDTDRTRQAEAFRDGWDWAKEASYLDIERFLRVGSSSDGLPSGPDEIWSHGIMRVKVRRRNLPIEVAEHDDYRSNFCWGVRTLLVAIKDKI